MRTNNTFGVQFITRINKAKNGLLPVYARFSVDGHRVEVSLKRFIHPDNWNDAKGSAKGKSEAETHFVILHLCIINTIHCNISISKSFI
jgi:hypothetical protein